MNGLHRCWKWEFIEIPSTKWIRHNLSICSKSALSHLIKNAWILPWTETIESKWPNAISISQIIHQKLELIIHTHSNNGTWGCFCWKVWRQHADRWFHYDLISNYDLFPAKWYISRISALLLFFCWLQLLPYIQIKFKWVCIETGLDYTWIACKMSIFCEWYCPTDTLSHSNKCMMLSIQVWLLAILSQP